MIFDEMKIHTSSAQWNGNLKNGIGVMNLDSESFEFPFTYASRYKTGKGTNPEELLGAAFTGCLAMYLSDRLDKSGYKPDSIDIKSELLVETKVDTFSITGILLNIEACVSNINLNLFQQYVIETVRDCPISKLMVGLDITLKVSMI